MVTPAISKPRRSRASKCKASTSTPEKKWLRFDALPGVATGHIVSFLLPWSKLNGYRSSPSSLETIFVLVNSSGSLRHVTQNAFHTVQFSVGRTTERESEAMPVRGESQRSSSPDAGAAACDRRRDPKHVYLWSTLGCITRAIAKHCTGLRKLSFWPCSIPRFPKVIFCAMAEFRSFSSLTSSSHVKPLRTTIQWNRPWNLRKTLPQENHFSFKVHVDAAILKTCTIDTIGRAVRSTPNTACIILRGRGLFHSGLDFERARPWSFFPNEFCTGHVILRGVQLYPLEGNARQ